jgi:hypothetical protein
MDLSNMSLGDLRNLQEQIKQEMKSVSIRKCKKHANRSWRSRKASAYP